MSTTDDRHPIKRILITPGEPAGIGPDITIQVAQQHWPAQLVAIADPELLSVRAKLLNLPLHLYEYDQQHTPIEHQPGTLAYLPVYLQAPVVSGQLNAANAAYVIETLKLAAFLCQQKQAHAVVTGPVHKEIINQAGIPFSGHTEFFSQVCQHVPTVMLFALEHIKVALVTTHLPLKEVPAAITQQKIIQVLSIVNQGLRQYFNLITPNLLIAGLNPHAGEGGYLGREEIDVIIPALTQLKENGINVIGPLPADTIFTQKYLDQADAIVAMYHDQALPLIKYMGFGHAVNVTLGLPFIRTSVDHGTALDIAGTPLVDAKSLETAIQLALSMQYCHC